MLCVGGSLKEPFRNEQKSYSKAPIIEPLQDLFLYSTLWCGMVTDYWGCGTLFFFFMKFNVAYLCCLSLFCINRTQTDGTVVSSSKVNSGLQWGCGLMIPPPYLSVSVPCNNTFIISSFVCLCSFCIMSLTSKIASPKAEGRAFVCTVSVQQSSAHLSKQVWCEALPRCRLSCIDRFLSHLPFLKVMGTFNFLFCLMSLHIKSYKQLLGCVITSEYGFINVKKKKNMQIYSIHIIGLCCTI